MSDLTGQVAVVTGGGRGIGLAIARELAGAGCSVGLVARSSDELTNAARELSGADAAIAWRAADVSRPAEVEAAIRGLREELGPVDLLINNAGRGSGGTIAEADPEDWWNVIEVNLRGSFSCTQQVLPQMIERGRGRIVNIASNLGLAPSPGISSYACAKAAVVRLTDVLALELASTGVRAFAISPGLVQTRMTDEVVAFARKQNPEFQGFPASMLRAPELAARLVRRIAAGDADALSGRYIHVDDDLDEMLARAEEIQRDDLHVMRLRR